MSGVGAVSLSSADRARVEEIERLRAAGAPSTDALLARLDDPSWPVRRAAVAALASLGDAAASAMIASLRGERDSEARVAALVDALSASNGAPESALEALGDEPRPAIVCDAAAILGRRRSIASAPVLARWVAHPDDNVAVAAIEALGRLGHAAGIDAVVAAARSGRFFRVFPAIDVLARSGDPRALEPLEELLGDPMCMLEAARALGRTGDLLAATPLAELLGSAQQQSVRVAAVALAEIDDHQHRVLGTPDAVGPALRALRDPASAARRVERSFDGAEPAERIALCRVLGWLGAETAAASLVGLLAADPVVASAAAHALSTLGSMGQRQMLAALRAGSSAQRALLLPLVPVHSDAAEDLRACLSDADATVRARACEWLGRIGDVSSVPALFERLGDPDPVVCQAAVGALHGLGSAETERLALEATRSRDARLRRAALRLVGYFGWSRAVDTVIDALRDDDERARDAAIHALASIDDARALDALLDVARGPHPRARASALRALGQAEASERALAALAAGLRDPDAWARYFACQSLGKLGASGALDAMLPLLDDPAGQVRVAAIEALARLPGERPVDALVAAAASSDPDARRAALLGLGMVHSERGYPAIVEALRAGDVSTRLVAISALAAFEGDRVDELLLEASRDPDASIRASALGFLGARPGDGATRRLLGLLDEESAGEDAALALTQHTLGRIPAILAALEVADATRARRLVSILSRMHRGDASAALGVALAMDRVEARRAAAAALAAGDARQAAVTLARAASADPDLEVRRLATFALSHR